MHPQMVRGQGQIHNTDPGSRSKTSQHCGCMPTNDKCLAPRGLLTTTRASVFLLKGCAWKSGWFTHRARSSLDDDRSNSWAAVPETLHQEGAPSPCCPFSDAGLSCWNTATEEVCVYVCVCLSITHTYEQIPREDPHTHRQVASDHKQTAAIWAKANNELYVFLQQLLIQTLVAGYWGGGGGPVYNGIFWSRHCHNNVEHHIRSIHTDSNRTALSHKSPMQLLYL